MFCPSCGTQNHDEATFCASCGASLKAVTAANTTVSAYGASPTSSFPSNAQNGDKKLAREEALRDVKLYLANGWNLKEETPEYFLLTRNEASTTVHVLLFLFTAWWTLFIPNVIYHFMKKSTKKILK